MIILSNNLDFSIGQLISEHDVGECDGGIGHIVGYELLSNDEIIFILQSTGANKMVDRYSQTTPYMFDI